MRRRDGYWWAISIRQEDDRPEIINVDTYSFGQMATRIGDSDPFDLMEFDFIHPVDTSRWPKACRVDQATVHEGYWWVLEPGDGHQIVLVGKDGYVRDFNGDLESRVDNFEFLMPIDTSGWSNDHQP